MNDKQIVDLFVKQVKQACDTTGEPLPEIVKNHQPGDDRLYRTKEIGFADDPDFDEINNNTDERDYSGNGLMSPKNAEPFHQS